ncbi:MAG: hypothetical protein GY878_30635 [Fuerstiella sp.]|nr:hypothetical protein [Fuerstiella sp.]
MPWIKTVAAAMLFRGIALFATIVLFSWQAICQETESSTATGQTEAGGLPFLIENLGSPDFARRAAASKQLKQLTADEIRMLASLSAEQPSAEVIIRLLAEVDARYASDDEQTVRAASDALESLSETTRIVLAEGANESLRKHWQTRIDLAIKELEKNGAYVKNGAFAQAQGIRWGQRRSITEVNIFIDESWQGGAEALKVFRRLSALVAPIGAAGGMKVYLLDGHPLSDGQRAELTELVGQSGIAERSRVALGITPAPGNQESGVLIGTVSRGSTAASADLRFGDLILRLSATAPKTSKEDAPNAAADLTGFDDLVERLKEFRPGDVVYLTMVRGARRPNPGQPDAKPTYGPEVVKVTLKGWRDLKTNTP